MGCELSPDEIIQDFKTFYFDTALSAHESTLGMMKTFVSRDRLLFGTDFPGECFCLHVLAIDMILGVAISTEMAGWYTKNLEDFYADDKDALDDVMYKNALKLFPRLMDVLTMDK